MAVTPNLTPAGARDLRFRFPPPVIVRSADFAESTLQFGPSGTHDNRRTVPAASVRASVTSVARNRPDTSAVVADRQGSADRRS
jgi:hypothetical protein